VAHRPSAFARDADILRSNEDQRLTIRAANRECASMATNAEPSGIRLWTIFALAGLAWGLIALAYASLAPASYIPRIFHNYHVEHFAAFYVVALLGAAALPSVSLLRVGLILSLLAAAFAAFRILELIDKVFYVEDLACDIGGVLAALVPMIVGRFRQMSSWRATPR
jgi:hypothetical protein